MYIDERVVRRLNKLLFHFGGLSSFIGVLDQAAQQDPVGIRDMLERAFYRWVYG